MRINAGPSLMSLAYPSQRLINPYTPPYLSGVPAEVGGTFRLDPFIYIYDRVLSASQTGLQEQLNISTDADFMIQGISVPVATGLFSFQVSDARLYYLSNVALLSTIFSTDPTIPQPIIGDFDTETEAGGLWIPAGSKVSLTLNDLSAAPNTISIYFHGIKRLKIGG